MTSRERILATLDHRQPDRVPIDFGGTNITGIHVCAYNALKGYLGISDAKSRIFDTYQQLALVEEPLRRAFSCDAVGVFMEPTEWAEWLLPDGTTAEVPKYWKPVRQEDGSDVIYGLDGKPMLKRLASSYWFSPTGPLCPGLQSVSDIEKYKPIIKLMDRPPYFDQPLEELVRRARHLREHTDYAVIGAYGGHIFAASQLLRGMDNFMCDLVLDKTFASALMETIAEAHMEEFEEYIEAVGPYVHVVQISDDLGSQIGGQISLETFRELVRPPMERWYRFMKSKMKDAKLFLHSCGSIYQFLPDLIEMGVDIINPIQVSAKDMDTARLKKEFGNEIVFWGGGCDTQNVLPYGTPEDVREEVKRRVNDLAPGGGFVFAQVHNIQPGVPPENIEAMFEAAREFGAY
jgi:uroporphyrinogen decarboxylase